MIHVRIGAKKEEAGILNLKGILENAFQTLRTNVFSEAGNNVTFDEACQSSITVSGKIIGTAGRLNKEVIKNWEIKNQDIYFAEIDLEELFALSIPKIKFEVIANLLKGFQLYQFQELP